MIHRVGKEQHRLTTQRVRDRSMISFGNADHPQLPLKTLKLRVCKSKACLWKLSLHAQHQHLDIGKELSGVLGQPKRQECGVLLNEVQKFLDSIL